MITLDSFVKRQAWQTWQLFTIHCLFVTSINNFGLTFDGGCQLSSNLIGTRNLFHNKNEISQETKLFEDTLQSRKTLKTNWLLRDVVKSLGNHFHYANEHETAAKEIIDFVVGGQMMKV